MPHPVVAHQEAEILVVVVHVSSQHIHDRQKKQLLEFCRQNADTAGGVEQAFVTVGRGLHGGQRLHMYLFPSPAVKPFGQEMGGLLALHQIRRHHVQPGILRHEIIAVLNARSGNIRMLVELDNHGDVSGLWGRYLTGVAFVRFRIDVDDRFRPAPSGGRTYLEQALDHEVRLYLDLEVLRLVQRRLGQLVEVGYLDLERLFHLFGCRRQKFQRPHAPPADIRQTVEGRQFPCADAMGFCPFVEYLVSPVVRQ